MDADPRHLGKSWLHDLRRVLQAVMLLMTAVFSLQGQGVYRFKSYGPDQGLKNLATTCMAQDDDGYLWVGTEGGLFRYDGQRFRGFGVAEGLPDLMVNGITPLSLSAGLFVLTQSGPFRFDGKRFQAWTAAQGVDPKGWAVVARDGPSRVWMGSRTGLSLSEDGGLTFHPAAGFPAGSASALAVDHRSGALYALRRTGPEGHRESSLVRLMRGQFELAELPATIRKDGFGSILVDPSGRIWLRGPGRLIRIAAWKSEPEDLTSQLPGKPAQSSTLSVDSEGRVWAATDSGLACFEKDHTWILGEDRGLPSPWANSTLTDREGSLWVAAEGVHRLEGRFLWTAYTRKQGLPVDNVWGIHRSHDGGLWALTPRGMVTWRAGRWVLVPETKERSLYAITEDSDGGLWVGGNSASGSSPLPNTLFYRTAGQTHFREIPVPSLKRNTVNSLAGGNDGTIWIGTQQSGLYRLRKIGGAHVGEAVALPGGTATETVNRVLVDSEGLVWTAGNQGLCLLDGLGWHRFGLAEGLKELNPSSLARDPDGSLWIGYWTVHGLTHLAREGGVWKVREHIQEPVELFEDDIVSMDCDARGILWFGTTQGVKRWDGHRFERFGRSQGLPGEDCTANALYLDTNGDVWVGLSAGIAQFRSSSYRGLPAPPEARITLMKDGGGHSHQKGMIPEIPYRFGSVDFAFTSLSFLDEAHLKPQLRLVGFEDAWRDTASREARYTTLPPGRYRFEVRFGDVNGQFGEPAVQAFVILSPWWQKPWFLLLAAMALVGLVLLTIRQRTARLLRRTQALEAQVRQRTLDLQQANEALHEANVALEEASMVDSLTNLRNRRYMGLHMPDEETRVLRVYRTFLASGEAGLPKGEDLVFLLMDLDHFKEVNDTYGHAVGDQVLRETAAILLKACRETDTVVRWGGEEFLVVARRTDRAAASGIAEKIRDTMGSYQFDLGGGIKLQRTCSVGFAAFPLLPGHPSTFHWEDAVEIADQCLYAVKRSGRDGWVGITCEAVDPDMAWAPRLLSDLPGLAAEGKVVLRTSFSDPAALKWQGHL